MTDPSPEAISVDVILTEGGGDDLQSVSMESITAATDDPSTTASLDFDEQEEDEGSRGHDRSRRKRKRADFPWSHTHEWKSGDPPRQQGKRKCLVCQKWFSSATNAQGWKVHLSVQHHVTAKSLHKDAVSSDSSMHVGRKMSQQATIQSMPLPQHVLRKYENAIVDYVIGGDISLRAAGEPRFQQLVASLTNGYKPPSTRTILRRTVELFNIAQPLLANFLCNLDSCVSLTMDGWSNRNLKGFYVVTAHWIDTRSGAMKNLLLTILDVSCGTGVGNRVGSALFSYLINAVGEAFLPRLLHVVTDNGSDACAAVNRLFHLVNSHVGNKILWPSNHVRCADHSVQRGVLSILSQVKEINAKLRGALVSIRRSKVMRQEYRLEAQRLGYASKEPTHQDSPTRWNSTHEMCSDALQKREALDLTMMLHEDDLGTSSLSDLEWSKVRAVMDFLRVPRQVMESLAADRKSSLDLVQLSIAHLIKHCKVKEEELARIHPSLSAADMKAKLEMHETKLVQLPALIAGYLNPQIPKATDPTQLKELKLIIRSVLQDRYSDKLQVIAPRPVAEQSNATLFEVLFAGSDASAATNQVGNSEDAHHCDDEVDRYLAMGKVVSQSFIDIVQWWMGRKNVLPAHYQMAMDYLGTPATSTPSERVNSMAGREFTSARQSLSSDIFVKTMCLRSWMKLGEIKIPHDRHRAMVALASTRPPGESVDAVVSMIEVEQEEWVEEVLDDSVVGMLNTQFDNMFADESDNLV
jgi:hypothetical protein